MQSQRLSRVNERLREILADLIETRVRDPRRGFVTVIRVDTTSDLSLARVYVSVLGSPQQVTESLGVLNRARTFLRAEAARQVDLRLMPELRFVHDDTLAQADRIDRILKKVERGETIDDDEDPNP